MCARTTHRVGPYTHKSIIYHPWQSYSVRYSVRLCLIEKRCTHNIEIVVHAIEALLSRSVKQVCMIDVRQRFIGQGSTNRKIEGFIGQGNTNRKIEGKNIRNNFFPRN